MLVRWWNGDCDGTGDDWLDASNAKILVASSSDKSGLSNGQTSNLGVLVSETSYTSVDLTSSTVTPKNVLFTYFMSLRPFHT